MRGPHLKKRRKKTAPGGTWTEDLGYGPTLLLGNFDVDILTTIVTCSKAGLKKHINIGIQR